MSREFEHAEIAVACAFGDTVSVGCQHPPLPRSHSFGQLPGQSDRRCSHVFTGEVPRRSLKGDGRVQFVMLGRCCGVGFASEYSYLVGGKGLRSWWRVFVFLSCLSVAFSAASGGGWPRAAGSCLGHGRRVAHCSASCSGHTQAHVWRCLFETLTPMVSRPSFHAAPLGHREEVVVAAQVLSC
jgi:hypothetical protein